MSRESSTKIEPRLLGAKLQEARRLAGLKQADVAAKLDLSRTTVIAIEKGERQVRSRELVAFAELYGISVNSLLKPSPPIVPLGVQLRAVSSQSEGSEALEAVIAEFQSLCMDYLELENLVQFPGYRRDPRPYPDSHGRPEQLGEDAASGERHRLALGDGPLLGLRDLLENDVGMRIFYLHTFPSKVSGMFAFNESVGGCVAVNFKHPHERRRMTIAHEYGHFVFDRHKPEVLTSQGVHRTPRSEKLADSFARCFLMPAPGLRRRFAEIKASRNGKATAADICRVAEQYQVSFEAMCRRLEELGLVRDGTFETLTARGFEASKARDELGLKAKLVSPYPLPHRYCFLVVEAYQRELITESQLAKYLRTSRLEARRIVDEHTTHSAVDESGQYQLFDLSLDQVVS